MHGRTHREGWHLAEGWRGSGGEERGAKPSQEGRGNWREEKIRVGPKLAPKASQKTLERAKIRVGPEEVRREVEPSLERLGDIMPDPLPW